MGRKVRKHDRHDYSDLEALRKKYRILKKSVGRIPQSKEWSQVGGNPGRLFKHFKSWIAFVALMEKKSESEIMMTKRCEYCHNKFKVPIHLLHTKKFCSHPCGMHSYRERHRDRLIKLDRQRHYKKYPRVEKKCLNCGKSFVLHGAKRHCSVNCRNEYHRKRAHERYINKNTS
jgi:hypothetical protein